MLIKRGCDSLIQGMISVTHVRTRSARVISKATVKREREIFINLDSTVNGLLDVQRIFARVQKMDE